ncbi:DUF1934 domain-containing protein [Levilactobacillus bambusae]|uniref:DUF1934 domain-containing protein n=1 Tax=Levilactobacillus bambusae TaxID=2024736 RepID=A0A2V1MXP5_9LACO|nr:DUF1934 domain-containing protein [Levilactobacillus bambusae]PWF99317.1 DUF1934 domain-containing protein [Levilactobacillus bambusae]
MDEQKAGTPIAIHLQTEIKQDDDITSYKLDVQGRLVQMGQTIYIRYVEQDPESDYQPVPVTMKLSANGDVQLTRSAENRLRLLFKAGKRIRAQYQTPFGSIPVETVTPLLDVSFRDRPFGGNVKIDYNLYANGELVGDYKIRLQFTA